MTKNTITSFQYSTLLFFLLNSFIMNIGYHVLLKNENTDVLLDCILGGIGIFLLFLLLFSFQRRIKLSIISYIQQRFSILGQGFFFLTFFLLISLGMIHSFSNLSSFIHSFILKDISILGITATLIITIFYIVSKGINTITKLSEILFYFYCFLFFIGMIGLVHFLDFSNLKPLFTSSLSQHLNNSLTFFSGSIIPIFLLFNIPYSQIIWTKKNKKFPYYLLLFSILLICIQLIFIISIFGIQLANIYEFPDMILYKKISFLNLLERVEVFLAFQHFLNSLFLLITGCYFLKEIVNLCSKRKKEKVSIVLIGSFLFLTSNLISFDSKIYSSFNFFFFFILFFLLMSLIHGKYNHKQLNNL